MTTSVNEVLFFILLGVFFIIFFLATNYFYVGSGSSTKKGAMLTVAAIVFSLFFVGYSQVSGACKNEGFKDGYQYTGKAGDQNRAHGNGIGGSEMSSCPSPGASLCRGGRYMWQGDSQRAKFCRNLASTPDGMAAIAQRSCGAGYVGGGEGNGFKFTPISGPNWNNKRCDTPGGCDIGSNGIF